MKTISLLFSILLLSNCSTVHETIEKKVTVHNFDEIVTKGVANIVISDGYNPESVTLVGEKKIIDEYKITSNDRQLIINSPSIDVSSGRLPTIYINNVKIEKITTEGVVSIDGENTQQSAKLDINTAGTSNIKLNIACENLAVSTSGVSNITLKGKAKNAVINAKDVSILNFENAIFETAKVQASKTSQCTINVTDKLDASATELAKINYKHYNSLKLTQTSNKFGKITVY